MSMTAVPMASGRGGFAVRRVAGQVDARHEPEPGEQERRCHGCEHDRIRAAPSRHCSQHGGRREDLVVDGKDLADERPCSVRGQLDEHQRREHECEEDHAAEDDAGEQEGQRGDDTFQHVEPSGIPLSVGKASRALDLRRRETSSSSAMSKPTVFYNGSCPVCRAEIEHYQHLDAGAEAALAWSDISASPDAARAFGMAPEAMRRRLHAVDANGRLLVGVPGAGT